MPTQLTRIPSRRLASSVVALACLAAPAPASAKNATAKVTDIAGDSTAPAVDITATRVTYNPAKGAISITLTTQDPIDAVAHDAAFSVVLLGKKRGTCGAPLISVVSQFSKPEETFAVPVKGTKVGKAYPGKGAVHGNTFTLTAKGAPFKKQTLGCAYVSLDTADADGTPLDDADGVFK